MFGMSWADTLRIVLMGIFILVCICLLDFLFSEKLPSREETFIINLFKL